MSHLFTVENNVAIPNTETLLISPFKEVWERDKSKDKGQAIKEFTFVELMSSKKKANPYSGYSDDTRFEKLKEALFDEDWEPDNLIEQCLAKINEFQKEASPTYSYYLSVIEAAEKCKIELSNTTQSEINLPYITVVDGQPKHLVMTLNRAKFDQ